MMCAVCLLWATATPRHARLTTSRRNYWEEAIELIGGKYETEASGGINLDNIISYARTGVDYVSCGAISTNHAVSMDLSLKSTQYIEQILSLLLLSRCH